MDDNTMTLFLTKSQVEELNYQQCVRHLKLLTTRYDIDLPLTECWQDVWPDLDQICDTLLELEDRIRRFDDVRIPSMDKDA
jgi:hypothetical protein